jgi:hypothetical protein
VDPVRITLGGLQRATDTIESIGRVSNEVGCRDNEADALARLVEVFIVFSAPDMNRLVGGNIPAVPIDVSDRVPMLAYQDRKVLPSCTETGLFPG